MDSVVPFLGLAAVTYLVINLVKAVSNRDFKTLLIFIIGWALGTAGAWLLAESDWGSAVTWGPDEAKVVLSEVNFASIVLLGLAIAGVAAGFFDFVTARNNNDTRVLPHLRTSRTPPPGQ